jgi:hypothetical protein
VIALIAAAVTMAASASAGAASRVSGSKWTKTTCGALSDFQESVNHRLSALQTSLLQGSGPFDLAALKGTVSAALDGATGDAAVLASTIERAGVPDVKNGKKIAQALSDAVQSERAMLPDLKTRVDAIVADAIVAFLSQVSQVGDSLASQTKTIAAQLVKQVRALDRSHQVKKFVSCAAVLTR